MSTILYQSASRVKPRNFRTHKWRSSNNRSNTLTETFWVVRTPIRKFKYIEYLQLKVLLGLADNSEAQACYDAPGVLNDRLFIDALRAWKTTTPRNVLWQRLQLMQELLQRPVWSENLYYTYDGTFKYELEEIRRPIRKVKKYSGYVRNSSSVGSKRASGFTKPEPERFEWNLDVEIDYYQFLTVGEFDSGQPGKVFFALTRAKSSKRSPKNKKR